MKRDYYELLGLAKGADPSAIKKAYRKLAKKDGAEIIKEREQRAEAKQRKKRKGRSDAFD